MRFNQEVKKWATDLHIFLHKAEHFLPHCNTSEEFTAKCLIVLRKSHNFCQMMKLRKCCWNYGAPIKMVGSPILIRRRQRDSDKKDNYADAHAGYMVISVP